jgi:predicted nicotinamide N-methyase
VKTLDDEAIGARFQDLHDRLRQPGADVIVGRPHRRTRA